MQANVGRPTQIEFVVSRTLRRLHLRFRRRTRPVASLRCTPDFVLRTQRACVFIDGCFWHGCPKHFTLPKANAEWWAEKIEANRERDRRQGRELAERSWAVVRIWEHEVDLRSETLTPPALRRVEAVAGRSPGARGPRASASGS